MLYKLYTANVNDCRHWNKKTLLDVKHHWFTVCPVCATLWHLSALSVQNIYDTFFTSYFSVFCLHITQIIVTHSLDKMLNRWLLFNTSTITDHIAIPLCHTATWCLSKYDRQSYKKSLFVGYIHERIAHGVVYNIIFGYFMYEYILRISGVYERLIRTCVCPSMYDQPRYDPFYFVNIFYSVV